MKWLCASCGQLARTNRQKCPRCGSGVWKPAPKNDSTELSGPLKQIAPRGLLLANPGKQTSVEESDAIECGTCHAVIYRVGKEFDVKALEEARNAHYSISPECREKK
jgi:ribosomal protein S27AE